MSQRLLWSVLFVFFILGIVVLSISIKKKQSPHYQTDTPPTETVVVTEAGQEQELLQALGIVDSWEPQTGHLIFHKDQVKYDITVDSARMRVMVNSLATTCKDLVISHQEDPNWIGAFCQGDFVVLRRSGHHARRVCAIQPDAKTFWGE